MSGLKYSAYDNNRNFNNYNSATNFSIFNSAPNRTGTVTVIGASDRDNNLRTYQFSKKEYIALKFEGYFTPDVSGNWGFILGTTEKNRPNDDLSYLWIGDNALNPTKDNYSKMCYYYSPFSSAYVYMQLTAGVSYPLLLYWGQSWGGYVIYLGIIPPGGNVTYQGSKYYSLEPRIIPNPPCASITPSWVFPNSLNNFYALKQNGYKTNWSNLGVKSNSNMSVSFSLKINNTNSQWRNIFHITNTNRDCCNLGDRVPGVWVTPNRSVLYISSSTSTDYDNTFDSNTLELKKEHFVTIVWDNLNNTYVYVNGRLNKKYNYTGRLTSVNDKTILYIGDPWYIQDGGLLIKNFSFYNCCLSESNILLIYQSTLNTSCQYQLSSIEQDCYKNNYPIDLLTMNGIQLQNHWSTIGCNQKRNNQCPSQQASSGLYNYKGCYNDTSMRAIPKFQKKVNSIDECSLIAEKNNQNVFGVQNNGECYTGLNVEQALQYNPNFNGEECSKLGGTFKNQVYIRNKLFAPPTPPVPYLTKINFAESFKNIIEEEDENQKKNSLILIIIILIFLMLIVLPKLL
jgi:hypothetical protein